MSEVREPTGYFYAWWRGDPLPELACPEGFAAEATGDARLLAELAGLELAETQARLASGHHAYVARLGGQAVGSGWSARATVAIGELGIRLALPPAQRYLWDFGTLPAWRGRNVYPCLLRAIILAESEAQRFWIGHDLGNEASARGILKAGFRRVAQVYVLPEGVRLRPLEPAERALAAAELLGLRLLEAGQRGR